MYHSNVLYDEKEEQTHHITQDNDGTINQSAELGKGEVVYNVGMTTVKRLPSPSVYSNVLYNGRHISITLPLLDILSSESEVGLTQDHECLPHSIIRGDNK